MFDISSWGHRPQTLVRARRASPLSFAVWMDGRSSPGFACWRMLVIAASVLTVSAALTAIGFGALLPFLLTLAVWPFPFRCRLDSRGISIRWLFICHRVPYDTIVDFRVAPDPRRLVMSERQAVLQIRQLRDRRLLLFAKPAVLYAMCHRMKLLCWANQLS